MIVQPQSSDLCSRTAATFLLLRDTKSGGFSGQVQYLGAAVASCGRSGVEELCSPSRLSWNARGDASTNLHQPCRRAACSTGYMPAPIPMAPSVQHMTWAQSTTMAEIRKTGLEQDRNQGWHVEEA